MIPRPLPDICIRCGHTRGWHSVSNGQGCTHEVVETKKPSVKVPQMKAPTWKRCDCEGWQE